MMWKSNTSLLDLELDIRNMKFVGLDICEWPNINHRIGLDIILKLSQSNSTLKASS